MAKVRLVDEATDVLVASFDSWALVESWLNTNWDQGLEYPRGITVWIHEGGATEYCAGIITNVPVYQDGDDGKIFGGAMLGIVPVPLVHPEWGDKHWEKVRG